MGNFVFPGANDGKQLSDMSLTAVQRRMKVAVTVHGFRSYVHGLGATESTDFPAIALIRRAPTRSPDKVKAAYLRGKLFEKRASLMVAWAAYCAKPREKANVIPSRGSAPRPTKLAATRTK